jgi:methylphosphotriester-DNA--protein-cysteine methyltransferase
VVVVSSGAKIFHVPGCPFIHDKASERTMTAKEAMQEGYVPCTRCLRQYLKTSLSGKPGEQVSHSADEEAEGEQEELLTTRGH